MMPRAWTEGTQCRCLAGHDVVKAHPRAPLPLAGTTLARLRLGPRIGTQRCRHMAGKGLSPIVMTGLGRGTLAWVGELAGASLTGCTIPAASRTVVACRERGVAEALHLACAWLGLSGGHLSLKAARKVQQGCITGSVGVSKQGPMTRWRHWRRASALPEPPLRSRGGRWLRQCTLAWMYAAEAVAHRRRRRIDAAVEHQRLHFGGPIGPAAGCGGTREAEVRHLAGENAMAACGRSRARLRRTNGRVLGLAPPVADFLGSER